MAEIEIPFPLKGIPIKPELTGRLKIDDTMIQTLAALCGWDGQARRLLTCALNGALHTVTPQISKIQNKASTGGNEDITYTAESTTEIMVMAHPTNSGDIWVNLDAAGAVDTGWYLDAGDYVQFSLNNIDRLHTFLVTSGDKVIVLQTV